MATNEPNPGNGFAVGGTVVGTVVGIVVGIGVGTGVATVGTGVGVGVGVANGTTTNAVLDDAVVSTLLAVNKYSSGLKFEVSTVNDHVFNAPLAPAITVQFPPIPENAPDWVLSVGLKELEIMFTKILSPTARFVVPETVNLSPIMCCVIGGMLIVGCPTVNWIMVYMSSIPGLSSACFKAAALSAVCPIVNKTFPALG